MKGRGSRLSSRLLAWLLPGPLGAEAADDLKAEFSRARSNGRVTALAWILRQVASASLWRLSRALRRRERIRPGRAAAPSRRALPAGLFVDARRLVRGLLRRPGFSALAVVTLAVGIGASTAVFSLAEAMVFRQLAVEDSDRLVRVFSTNPSRGSGWVGVSHPDFVDFSGRDDLFGSASLYSQTAADISGMGDPERVSVAQVHGGFFETLGTEARIGRLFDTGDLDPAALSVAILAESFWMRRFGADPDVIGEVVRLDGAPYTVVGVVDDDAAWPAGTDVWTPVQWGGTVPTFAEDRSNRAWEMLGRLAPRTDITDASEQIAAMARTIYAGPGIEAMDGGTAAIVVPLHSSGGGEGAGALFATLGAAVLFVLLLACLNASSLLMARARGRMGELSLRAALGAGRARLAWILFAECALLAAIGGGVGVFLGHSGLVWALRMAPPEIADLADVRLNGTVLLAALGIATLATVMAGFAPALRAAGVSLADSIKESGGALRGARGGRRLRRGMVVIELVLSLTLLVSAGLAVRGIQRQLAVDPGFEAGQMLSFSVRLPPTRYGDDALVDEYYERAVERMEALPGVISAASTSRLPMGAGGLVLGRSFITEGAEPPPSGPEYPGAWVEVDASFFETLGVAALEGRVIDDGDSADGLAVAVVNRRMSEMLSPGESVVGRTILPVAHEDLPRIVVGVVPDVQYNGVSRPVPTPVVFVPRRQAPRAAMSFLVRTAGDPGVAIPRVREALNDLDPDVALDALQPLRRAHATDLGGIRFLATVVGSLGFFALILAIGGVYGVVAQSVAERTREFGLRLAVGADPARLRGSVVLENLALIGVGLALGSVLAYAAGRVLESGMSGVARMEVSTYVIVGALLAGCVLAASWIPALRATRVDPVRALKSE